ncbi:divalent-cation tolerance protein CutA [Alteromonas halophila]|uniref:Divalent cation tolerance protein n=1 Tax=Alteromonas halophila TaxID=516698 RepID=A0A918JP40_9ALTE|nr:divalent-cation tolerance protein CutA [Alteromonas halophila]GGW90502.1 divalent cation tolerance protein [Alteromonas halophila]
MAAIIILSTAPSHASARQIADALIEARLAACVQLLPQLESVYHWDGKVESDNECQVIIKTTSDAQQAAFDKVSELHPYAVPQWLIINDVSGSDAYITWLHDEVSAPLKRQ